MTDRALARIHKTAAQEAVQVADAFLRIGVVPGGCSGLTYDLGWDTTKQPEDHLFSFGDVRVVLDLKSLLYLDGSTLDFSEGLDGQGFHFNNPQAARTCACGESFSI